MTANFRKLAFNLLFSMSGLSQSKARHGTTKCFRRSNAIHLPNNTTKKMIQSVSSLHVAWSELGLRRSSARLEKVCLNAAQKRTNVFVELHHLIFYSHLN